MSISSRPIATACVLAGVALLLFAFHISVAPLSSAEKAVNARAQSIRLGSTPVFFHADGDHWLQPAAVYANAALRAIGGDDVSGRLVSAIAAALGVGLTFAVAQTIAGRAWVGIVAALFLMLTPAYRSYAQLGTEAILPVPLTLLWLWSLLRFFRGDALRALALAAAALGLSVYSHPAAPLTAVLLWILTLTVARRRNRARLLVSTLVFSAAWLPAAAWFFRHFDTYPDTFGRWFIFAAHLRNPLDGLRAFMNPGTFGDRASMYWGFWDPSWLFFGTANAAAPLLMLAAPFIAIGLFRCLRHLSRETAALVIGTALIVPIAGATFGVSHYLSDAVMALAVMALLAAFGAEQLFALVTRRPLEDHVAMAAVDRWDRDDVAPEA